MVKKKKSLVIKKPPILNQTTLPHGVKLVRVLQGHTESIGHMAWSRNGALLASPSEDKTIRLWNPETGECLRMLEGHEDRVTNVVFDPSDRTLASASFDKTVKIWDVASGKLLFTMEGHDAYVWSVDFDSSGDILASGGADDTIKLWDVTTGNLIRTLEGHVKKVNSICFDPKGRTIISGSYDKTINIWEVASGKLLQTLEGHEESVHCVRFDPSGRTIASTSMDNTIKIWDSASGNLLRTLEGHSDFASKLVFSIDGRLLVSKGMKTVIVWRTDIYACIAEIQLCMDQHWLQCGLCIHPTLPLLASVESDPSTPTVKDSCLIHIWELDLDVLFNQSPSLSVAYTSAKIVMVGDHSVGKSGLGHRLVHHEFKEQASSHGQHFWLFPDLCKRRNDETECEAILWDLAGQPDYRLIHALFLDDADLALILFDSSDIRDPLHGVEFWLKQLRVAQSATKAGCPAILVAAQTDRGTSPLTQKELEEFCRNNGISGYVHTSAFTGEGLDELVDKMKSIILWDEKPATVTKANFKRIKDFVLELKENRSESQVIVTPKELHEWLQRIDAAWHFTLSDLLAALRHLENYGCVTRLSTSKGELRLLLVPELLNNLAASCVLEARRNPKGLGLLEEKLLLDGGYEFHELVNLSTEERGVLIDAVALLFLKHNVCFRETNPLNALSYLVFPELINLKKPILENEKPTEDDVAYTVSGAVENVFASLVVLLGYTHTFTRTNQWQKNARYEVGEGHICGFRQDAERDGEVDLVLYFSPDIGRPVRMLFQSLFESFLARRNLTVIRYEPVQCTNQDCQHPLDRSVVRQRLKEGKTFACCNECGERLHLPTVEQPIQLTRQQKMEVDVQRRAAEQRTVFEQAIFKLQAYLTDEEIKPPDCFISYAWGVAEHERWVEKLLAKDLQKAGIDVILDRWENARIGASVPRFVERIAKCQRIVVVGTLLYRTKYENGDPMRGYVVAAEGDLIGKRMIGIEKGKETVLPLLLEGTEEEAFPPLLQGRVYANFLKDEEYFRVAFNLILSIYQIRPDEPSVIGLVESLKETFE